MNWYLDSLGLLLGGLVCGLIGIVIAMAMGDKALGHIIGQVFAFVGVVAMIYAFAGDGLRPLQFLVVSALVVYLGFTAAKEKNWASKIIGIIMMALGGLAFLNSTLLPLDTPIFNQNYSNLVGDAFSTTGDVLNEILQRATENDPNPNRREPIS